MLSLETCRNLKDALNCSIYFLVWLMDPRGETERRETAPLDLTRATKSQEGLTSHEVIGPRS